MKSRIELLREIAADHQAQRIRIDGRKVYVDAFTANMLVTVYDALNAENAAKFIALPWMKMVGIGWKLVNARAAA